MKRIFVLLLVSVFVMTAATVFAAISATKHNLTSTGGQFTRSTSDEVTMCGLCHIPHGGSTTTTGLPIWARSNPTTVFTVYGGGVTLRNTTVNQPGTYSLTCLSCHDGTVAVGTWVKNTIPTVYGMQGNVDASNRLIDDSAATAYNPVVGAGGVLGNDHPVGFTYTNPGGTDGGIPGIDRPIVANPPRMVGAISGASFPLFMGTNQFECATCHDPHLANTGTTRTKFLRAPNAQICQDCHNLK